MEGMDGTIRIVDDGTLDTVLEYECKRCDQVEDVRFSEADRDDGGNIDDEWIEWALQTIADDHAQVCPVQE